MDRRWISMAKIREDKDGLQNEQICQIYSNERLKCNLT